MQLTPGTQLGPYKIEAQIGAGGMGEVFRARDTRLHRTVAIKVLPAAKAADAERKRRFLQEARAASALNHPNIVTLHDITTDGGIDCLVMEFVEGAALDSRIGKRMPVAEAVRCAAQVADALAAAHAAGIVHRDIKPGNIMLADGGRVKVLDFGIAKLTERTPEINDETVTQEPTLTETGAVMGTTAYMSPEQASGLAMDHRTDIFSLGVVLFEMVTGQRPFHGKSPVETMNEIINSPFPAIDVPAAPRDILEKCLAKDPRERYQHAGDLALDLRRYPRASEAAPTTPALRRIPLALAVGIAGITLAAALWFGRGSLSATDNPLDGAKFTRLTNFEGSELQAEISPDGKFFAFLSERAGPFDIWLGQIGSGRFSNLTKGQYGELLEATRSTGFSGDGAELWLRGGATLMTQATAIRLMPLMGGPPRPFLAGVVASWSPDGSKIVYHKGAPPGDPIFVADRSGGNPRQIFIDPNPGGHCHFPVWSKDARWIYFSRGNYATNEMDIWRIRPEGGDPERLTNQNTRVSWLAPIDSRTLLYTSPDEEGSGPWLFALDLESKVSRRISYGLEHYLSVSASADGRRVVATVANPSATLWSFTIREQPAAENDVKPYPVPTVRAMAPRLGRKGLYYLSSLSGGDGLWRVVDGQALEIRKGSDDPMQEPAAISPSGDRLAILLRGKGRVRLHVMNEDGTNLTALAESIDASGEPGWSPDGKWIAVGGEDAKGPGLFKVPLDGGEPVRLAATVATNPVWSPDGSMVVYSGPALGRHQPLRAIRPDGTPIEVPEILVRVQGERYRFLPDGKGLVYMDGLQRRQDFRLLNLATKTSRQLTRFENAAAMRTFDITPDGKTIVFDRLRENSDVVLIEIPERKN